MARQNIRQGILLMLAACLIFAVQDAFSRHLASATNVFMVVMIRFWVFGAFVLLLSARGAGLRAAARSRFPRLQAVRGVLLVAQICAIVVGFVHLGLVETHALFACYPLLVAALSGPVLGERVGWRRWTAIGVGFLGILVILQPGAGVFSPWALAPLAAAAGFALYGLLTRYVAQGDTAQVSFFWTGTVGAAAMTVAGIWFWEPMSPADWGLMAALCLSSISAHWLLIKAYEVAEASAIQPFAFSQLVFVSFIGPIVFDERVGANVVIGAAIVVAAGLFTLWRARVKGR